MDLIPLMLMTFCVHEAIWLSTNLFYIILDNSGWLQQYRITSERIPVNTQYDLLKELFGNHLILLLPLQLCAGPLFVYCGIVGIQRWPDLWTGFWQFLIFNIVEDTIFYWVHRLMHRPWFFKNVHEKHHHFDARYGHTFSLNGEYAHWVESFLNDLIPLMMGPILCGMTTGTTLGLFWLWIVYRQIRSADEHSGYNLPWHPLKVLGNWYHGPQGHIRHHTLAGRKNNFGSYVWWDWLMGTLA